MRRVRTPLNVQTVGDGMLPFHLADLQDIYTNLQDGNYWTAFRKAISLVDLFVNPGTGKNFAVKYTLDDASKITDCCENLDKWLEKVGDGKALGIPQFAEPNVDVVALPDIVAIIKIVMEFIRMWRQTQQNVGSGRPAMTTTSLLDPDILTLDTRNTVSGDALKNVTFDTVGSRIQNITTPKNFVPITEIPPVTTPIPSQDSAPAPQAENATPSPDTRDVNVNEVTGKDAVDSDAMAKFKEKTAATEVKKVEPVKTTATPPKPSNGW